MVNDGAEVSGKKEGTAIGASFREYRNKVRFDPRRRPPAPNQRKQQ
jgi:hypothetical protein